MLGISTVFEHQTSNSGCSCSDSSLDGIPFGMDYICRGFPTGGWLGASETVYHKTSCSVFGAKTWGSFERLPSFIGFWQMSKPFGIRRYVVLAFCVGEVLG